MRLGWKSNSTTLYTMVVVAVCVRVDPRKILIWALATDPRFASYRGGRLLLTTFYVTIYVTRTDSEISVEGTIIILTSKRSLHLKESPYLIFLKAVEFFSGFGTRFFRFSWQGRGSSERAATLAKCHPRGQYPNPMYPG